MLRLAVAERRGRVRVRSTRARTVIIESVYNVPGASGIRLVRVEAGEDKLSRKWDVWTDDGHRLQVRTIWSCLTVWRLPEPSEGTFSSDGRDPGRGVLVYGLVEDDYLFMRPLQDLGLEAEAMLTATGMVLLGED